MTPSTKSNVSEVLKSLQLPGLARRLGDIAKIGVDEAGDKVLSVSVALGFPAARAHAAFRDFVISALERELDNVEITVEFSTDIVAHGVQTSLKPLPGISNVIAVASGKGGVGKSTVAANLALALAADGARVGVLDADIYGPSQPHMFGVAGEQPESHDGKTMDPVESLGVKVMSIGFLIDPSQPMAWRGPMVTSALNQLLLQTNWGELDYLIVDMPPGTGDIQLTLTQRIPVSGSVIVTTPQDIALLDAKKGLQMFRKVSVPVLGIVENMSTHICSQCGHEDAVFGSGGGEAMAADFDVELLGKLPLDAAIREQADSGRPTVVAEPDGPRAAAYFDVARGVSSALAMRGKDYSSKFPNIVVEDS